jgi:Fe-Mn family superoxide dismutase
MQHNLPALPYALDALEPYISRETLTYHYNKHHQTYLNNLNKLIVDTEFATLSLSELVTQATGPILNNAAQVWNHTFYWHCLCQPQTTTVSTELSAALTKHFGSVEQFKQQFTQAAITVFGSGWAWLVKNKNGDLAIIQTSNAGNPMQQQQQALLTCDVWEHAYYIDYRNDRSMYVTQFWHLLNWDFVAANFAQ